MRRPGPMGALIDEYGKAMNDLSQVLTNLDQKIFELIVDNKTDNPDCRSFQTILSHVIQAGFGYSNYIREVFEKEITRDPIDISLKQVSDVSRLLGEVYQYQIDTVEDLYNIPENEFKSHHIPVRWNQEYDLEQILEHAIVHILRHRRQLEYFWSLILENKTLS